jgi:3-oxoacyl-[acyl-carrier protein] reductase
MENIRGKNVIITGATSGIGKAAALALAKEGGNLTLTARRANVLEEVCQACRKEGVEAYWYAGDITDEKTSVEVTKLALEKFGRIDILVSNAGMGLVQSFLDSSMEDYDRIMNTNMRSAYAICLHVIPEMVKNHSGQVVIIGSVTSLRGHGDETAYSASKFANRGFAQALNRQFRSEGIKVTLMDPSATDTNFEIGNGRTKEDNANKEMLKAEDVADAIVFACRMPKHARIREMVLAGMQGD